MMIQLTAISFGYSKKKPLFSNLQLNMKAGCVYGLLGKNGSGKTTLLKLFSGLVFPCSGNIAVLNHTPKHREPSLMREIFFIPEEFYLPSVRMGEFVKMNAPFYPRFDQNLLNTLLKEFEVDVNQRLDRKSYGQKKKAFISFGLACNTKLVLMDEPTNGLDIPSKSQFRKIVASAANEERSIIISTHQVRDLDNLIDAVVILDESRILLNADTETITDKLVFGPLDKDELALYAETSVRGRWGVKPNSNAEDSKLDMELLFNTVLANKNITELFNS